MPVPAQYAKKRNVVVFKDNIPVSGTASSPEYLASVLEDAGYNVRFVSADELCNQELMKKENFDVLVLPYGASYPAMGKDALISYLKGGGSFLSMGGYAFDNLLIRQDGEWKPLPEDMDIRINTRKGDARDSLGLYPDQIGVFDPSYPLKRVSYIEAAPDQFIFDSKFRINGEFEGYAASSMAASNNPVFPQRYGRWIPLLYARGAYGRLRASAGAIVHNYAGPYAGSSWAYFGVTNRDLFAPDNEAARSALVRLVDSLIDKKYIKELSVEFACYHLDALTNKFLRGDIQFPSPSTGEGQDGGEEDVKIFISGTAGCDVSLEIYADRNDEPVFRSRTKLTEDSAVVTWSPVGAGLKPVPTSDFYVVRAQLLSDGQTVDAVETGFVVWDEKVVSDGFPLKYSGNYFRADDRAVFLSGTNETGMMFASANENPLVWKQDLEKMSDYGVDILRILHFSPFVVSYTGHPRAEPKDLNVDALPKKLERQLDAIVQLCQKYKVILFLSLHDWMGVELTDEELIAQRRFAEVVSARYRNVPGIMYDVQNEPSVQLSNQPAVRCAFNEYLRGKYDCIDNLRAAWKKNPPTLVKEEDFPPLIKGGWGDLIEVSPGTEDWDDVKAFDANYFKTIILNRWVKANADGVEAGDPGRPLTVGYLPWMAPADKILGTEHINFSNMHFYGDPRDYPRQLKLIDRRFEGKSFSLGEFGAKVHPTWKLSGSITTMKGGIDWFLQVGHYALGMGASFIANWDWKDMPDCVFPWGINHPCDVVPKDILLAYRSQSMFFRMIEPKYEEPELYFLVPDSHRLGGQTKRVTEAILKGIDLLLGCHVDFGVINEYSLNNPRLKLSGVAACSTSAKAIIYPIPFCPSDEIYRLIRDFVRDGGVLYLSGDISYDDLRNRTRMDRLEELCGVRYVAENYPNIAGSEKAGPCIRVTPITADVLSRSEDGSPVITTNSFKKGRVFYCADPVESHATSPDVYREFLNFAGVKRIPLEPDDPFVRVFRLPTAKDETVYVLFNESGEGKKVTLNVEAEPITLKIGARKPGLVKVTQSAGHAVSMLESQGEITVDSKTLIDTDCHVMIAALDGEGIDSSKSLMVLPIEHGYVRIATGMDWKTPVVGVGEMRSGKWRCFDEIKAEFSNGCLSFRINELQSLNILLIAEAEDLDKLAKGL